MKIYIPLDSIAVALGADDVAAEFAAVAPAMQIVRTGSRGMSWLEPLVEVERNGVRYGFGPIAVRDVVSLMAKNFMESDEHDLALGSMDSITWLKRQQRLIFARCGITDPLSLVDYKAHNGLAGLRKALAVAPDNIVDEVTTSGLRGRGGAGFPAGIKWKTVADQTAPQKYIVCNADEGDSGTFADRMILEGDPFLLIEGMIIAGLATGATQGFVYLRSEYPIAANIFSEALKIAYANNLLGDTILGSDKSFTIELFIGAGAYICGEESSLLNSLEGKRGEVRAKPPIPAIAGLFDQPTLVHNTISLCSVPVILAKGAPYYRDFGMGKSMGTMPFQIAGNVKHGGLVECAFGVTLRTLVEDFGGGTRSCRPLRAVQVGGPLGAYLPASMLDLPMDYETLAARGAGVGHGGVVVFDDTVNLAEQARYAFEFCAHESCGKCTPCRIGAVRGAETMEKIIAGEDVADNIDLVRDLCYTMEDGSLCAMGGMTPIPVRSALEHFAKDFGV